MTAGHRGYMRELGKQYKLHHHNHSQSYISRRPCRSIYPMVISSSEVLGSLHVLYSTMNTSAQYPPIYFPYINHIGQCKTPRRRQTCYYFCTSSPAARLIGPSMLYTSRRRRASLCYRHDKPICGGGSCTQDILVALCVSGFPGSSNTSPVTLSILRRTPLPYHPHGEVGPGLMGVVGVGRRVAYHLA